MDNFDPYNVLLATATNIPVLLKTGFVLQGHNFMTDVYQCNILYMCNIIYYTSNNL